MDRSVDSAIIAVLELFLQEENMERASIEDIFYYLSNIFRVTINEYESCFKFSESDVFVYEENKT